MNGTSPAKATGLNQGLFQTSSTAVEALGRKITLDDGREFVYAKAGTSALSAGKMGVAAAIQSDLVNVSVASAAAIGDTNLTLTVSAGATLAAGQLTGGFLQVNDATGEGHQYQITGNTALASDGTSVTISLADPIRVALVADTSQVTLVHSPFYGVVESATEESMPVGVAPVAVTATHYYWAQTKGVACCLVAGTPAVGTPLTLSATAGALAALTGTVADTTASLTMPIVGQMLGTAGVATEYKPVYLNIV